MDERGEAPEERGKAEGGACPEMDLNIFHIWADGVRWVMRARKSFQEVLFSAKSVLTAIAVDLFRAVLFAGVGKRLNKWMALRRLLTASWQDAFHQGFPGRLGVAEDRSGKYLFEVFKTTVSKEI